MAKKKQQRNADGVSRQIERIVMLPHINVELDFDYGWIVELPQTYETGIEYETHSKHETRQNAILEAKEIYGKIKMPIVIWNINNTKTILYRRAA